MFPVQPMDPAKENKKVDECLFVVVWNTTGMHKVKNAPLLHITERGKLDKTYPMLLMR